jgi:hypothetical protein
MQSQRLLWHGVLAASEKFPERAACEILLPLSYRDLVDRARRIAATIQCEGVRDAVPLTAVFGIRRRQLTPVFWEHSWPGTATFL